MEVIVFLGILAVPAGLIWLIYALIRRKKKLAPILTMVIGLAVFIVGISTLPRDDETAKASTNTEKTVETTSNSQGSAKKGSSKEDTKEINGYINDRLREDQGFANGTLDENGKETDNGEPNPEFNWATTVDKIQYDGQSTVAIFVNDGFMDYDKEEAQSVLNKAQNVAYEAIGDKQDWEDEEYRKGLPTNVKHGDSKIATTKTLNTKEFKWND
ncbi:MAG: hypothetical protein L0L14_10345 [Tetragenococcus koreensis]|nr:hypothetical protein [Tetragenococcus koreensis]